jgi:hypothetical protein
MGTQAELARDSKQRICRLESLIKEYPNDQGLKVLLREENELLDLVLKTN